MEQNPDTTKPNITKFPIQQTIQKAKLYPDITNIINIIMQLKLIAQQINRDAYRT